MNEVHQLIESQLAAKLTAPLEDKGIKALACWDNGVKVFSVRGEEPLRKVPDDFRDKHFRVQNSYASMVELTPEESEQWRQATQPVEAKLAPDIGPALIADIQNY
jgi:TRAP-type C4-dicarboxylate transport system substrate-binding protein